MVSVIIPVYNVEEYLRECVDSVLAQTYTDIEIILVDDGSPDNCGAICDEYAAKDERVRVIHQHNQGIAATRNTGLDAVRGEYIVFLDSDDYLKPDMVQQLHTVCKEQQADMCCCSYVYKKGEKLCDRQEQNMPSAQMELYEGNQRLDNYIRDRKFAHAVWAKMFAAELFNGIRFPEGRLYEDVFVMPILVQKARRIANIRYEGCVYRKREDSITNGNFGIEQADRLESRLAQLDFVKKVRPDLAPYAVVNLLDISKLQLYRIVRSGGKQEYTEFEKRLQRIHRKHICTYIKYGRSRNDIVFMALAAINIHLAKLMAAFLLKRAKR